MVMFFCQWMIEFLLSLFFRHVVWADFTNII